MADSNRSDAIHVAELLAQSDLEFVCRAYEIILRHPPDVHGCAHYLRNIRAGMSKERVIVELSSSADKRYRRELAGLRMLVMRYRISRLPVIGVLGGMVLKLDGERACDYRRRATENSRWRARAREHAAGHVVYGGELWDGGTRSSTATNFPS
jgi:hypothetical protein